MTNKTMTPPEKKQKLNVNKEDLLTDNYILNNLNKDILTPEFIDNKVREIQESTPMNGAFWINHLILHC